MSYRDVYTSERIMENLAEENVQKAEARRLARELRAGHQGWFTRQFCCLGQRLAHLMIAAGQRLDRMTLPPAGAAEFK